MSLPYTYLPRPGEGVTVDRHGNGHDDADLTVCSGPAGGTVRIRQDEVPGVAAGIASAMHEAAGLPAPVILERPEIVADGDGETGINIFTVRAEPHLGSLSIRYHGAPSAAVIAPGPARLLASVVAAYADAAEAAREPDPAEVEELTAILRGAVPGMAPPGGDYKTAVARGFAETAIRAGWRKQREGGAS